MSVQHNVSSTPTLTHVDLCWSMDLVSHNLLTGDDPRYQHLRFIRLTSPQQVDEFIASLS